MAAEDLSNKGSRRWLVRNYVVNPRIRSVDLSVADSITNPSKEKAHAHQSQFICSSHLCRGPWLSPYISVSAIKA